MEAFIIYLVLCAIIEGIVAVIYCKNHYCKWYETIAIVFCAIGLSWLILPKDIAHMVYENIYK